MENGYYIAFYQDEYTVIKYENNYYNDGIPGILIHGWEYPVDASEFKIISKIEFPSE